MKRYLMGVFSVLFVIAVYKLSIFVLTVHVSVAQKTYLSVMPTTSNGGVADGWCVVDPKEYSGLAEMPKSYVQVDGMRGDTAVVTVLNPGDSGCKAGSAVYTPISLLRKAIYRQKTKK